MELGISAFRVELYNEVKFFSTKEDMHDWIARKQTQVIEICAKLPAKQRESFRKKLMLGKVSLPEIV